jgi:hypothetical protein
MRRAAAHFMLMASHEAFQGATYAAIEQFLPRYLFTSFEFDFWI